jgi:hypothetical protein
MNIVVKQEFPYPEGADIKRRRPKRYLRQPVSIILLHMAYNKEETGIKTVIKLLLRCIKLYESLDQVKKVLKTIVQLESTENASGIGQVLQLKAKLEDLDKWKDELAERLQTEAEMGLSGSQKLLSDKKTKTPPSEGAFVYPYTKSINESSEKQLDLASRMDAEE